AFAVRVAGGAVERFGGETMGTNWSLQAVAPPAGVARGVKTAFDRVVGQMSQWEPESDLSRINRAPPSEWRAVPPECERVLAAAMEIAEASDGAFDPGLGLLTERWGFGSAGPVAGVPADRSSPDRSIAFDPAGARIRRGADAALDLSGIAKGFGVEIGRASG